MKKAFSHKKPQEESSKEKVPEENCKQKEFDESPEEETSCCQIKKKKVDKNRPEDPE